MNFYGADGFADVLQQIFSPGVEIASPGVEKHEIASPGVEKRVSGVINKVISKVINKVVSKVISKAISKVISKAISQVINKVINKVIVVEGNEVDDPRGGDLALASPLPLAGA